MSSSRDDAVCAYWDYSNCEGTAYCPPRCPRFVDKTGTPLIIRRFADDDFESIVKMYEELDRANRTMGLPPIRDDWLRDWLRTLTRKGWNMIALDGDRVVGHVGAGPSSASEPEFVIFVLDEYQNCGLGVELIKHAIASAAAREHDALTLAASKDNCRAIIVYKNIGFEVIEEWATEIAMRLPLDDLVAERVRHPPAER